MPSRAATAMIAVVTATCLAAAPATRPTPAKPTGFAAAFPGSSPLARRVGQMADAALDAAGEDLPGAQSKADAALDLVTRYGTARDVDAYREAAFARRLLHQLADAPEDHRGDLLAFLRRNPPLAHAVAFAVPDDRGADGVYALLDRLRLARPKQAVAFPELTAALCLVRDRPLKRRLNENTATAADPVAIFDFYVTHERQMFYGLHGVPVELLAYVVDTTASPAELTWALGKYAGTRDTGSLFFKVKYDMAYFQGQGDKGLDAARGGYTLPNVLAYGGVCIDQAYFATGVGKAIGVPTAIATATSGEAGHAWVGFLRASPDGRGAAWDFDSGRYPEYKGIRGDVTDPLTREGIADSTVGLLGDLIGTTAVQRQDAAALTDAAVLLGRADDPPAYPADLLANPHAKPPPPRPATADGQLDLIEQSFRQLAADPRAWAVVADLAKGGKLSLPQKKKLAQQVQQLCGPRHPDFAVSVLTPMVQTVADPAEQSRLWDAAFALVQARPDLAAEVRFRQASLWEQHDDLPRAGRAYADVTDHYLNAGPFAVKALAGAASILRKMNQPEKVLLMYGEAAKRVAKPSMVGRAEFLKQSNWYKVRQAYAQELAKAGQTAQADRIRSEDAGG